MRKVKKAKVMRMMTMKWNRCFFSFLICGSLLASLQAQTIQEKKAGISSGSLGGDLTRDMQSVLVQVNKELIEDQTEINNLYTDVLNLYRNQAPEGAYKELVDRINAIRDEIENLENNWREMTSQTGHESSYSLWHQPESTLGQLIIDYGSQNYVYIMSPEIAAIKISVNSNIPIPRSSWNEMMELILNQNGVGFRQLNPYLRQLYLIKQDKSTIQLITNSRCDLEFVPPNTKIAFMLTPEPSHVRRAFAFLDKFTNPNTTVLQMIGRDILIIANADVVLDMLKLYDFVASTRGDKEYRIKTLNRVNPEEMAKILAAIFDQLVDTPKVQERFGERPGERERPLLGPLGSKTLVDAKQDKGNAPNEVNGLKVIPLTQIAQGLFLVGTKEEIKKAEEIIDQVEAQVGEARARVIHWYTAKHSDPEELAQVLERIYGLMMQVDVSNSENGEGDNANNENKIQIGITQPPPQPVFPAIPNPFNPTRVYTGDFYEQGGFIVNPAPVVPRVPLPVIPNQNRNNFIVDLKTGAIVMVVEADILPKLKELIKKLDIPKKMVQIEALVFEKRLKRQDNFGLNLLRIGQLASDKNVAGIAFNNIVTPNVLTPNFTNNFGILDFILSRKEDHGIPAFDLAYRFLIQQEDIQINANPTVVTVNQTPAVISVVEEISINNGVFLFNTGGNVTPQNSFTRAQYGITIAVTPTIHFNTDKDYFDDTPPYVTLDTDITFDTIAGIVNPQPDVTRRHITNQVSIPDGQTVVIGGLRRKNTDDLSNAIPYLGEIPGFGKLFSTTSMSEDSLELFVFLTPRIISDPLNDFERLKAQEMCGRPGDIPEFMCCLIEAQELEKHRLFAGTMNVLFGRPPDRIIPDEMFPACPLGEYDGR